MATYKVTTTFDSAPDEPYTETVKASTPNLAILERLARLLLEIADGGAEIDGLRFDVTGNVGTLILTSVEDYYTEETRFVAVEI